MSKAIASEKTIKLNLKNKGDETMRSTLKKESEDLFVITFEGNLTFGNLKEIEKIADRALVPGHKVNVLFSAENFSGCAVEGDWADIDFRVEHEHYIKKIAVVGTEERKQDLLMFLEADIRKAPVKFFPAGRESEAREWLQKGK